MDLTEFADVHIGAVIPDRGPFGRGTATVADLMRMRVTDVEPVIAAVYWSAVLRSRRFTAALLDTGAQPFDIGERDTLFERRRTRTIVVAHAEGSRHDLVVLSSDVPQSSDPRIVRPSLPHRNELIEGGRRSEPPPGFLRYAQDEDIPPEVLYDAMREFDARRNPLALVTAMPRFERTGASAALAVRCAMGGMGTVGVAATDILGRVVLTTAGHVIADGDVLQVHGMTVSVLERSDAVDTATLSHPQGPRGLHVSPRLGAPAVAVRGRRDVPGYGTRVAFDGARSGPLTTTVSGVDPGVTAGLRHTATHVYTPPVTAGGDSGAALLDSHNRVMGFCSERTAADEELEMSTWVWADQVLAVMGLTL